MSNPSFSRFWKLQISIVLIKNTWCFRCYRILKKGQQILAFQARQISVVLITNTDISMSYRILKKANSSFPAAMIALTLWAIKKKTSSQNQQRLHNNIILPKEDHIIDWSIGYLITCGFCNTQNNQCEICVISQGPKDEADNITGTLIILVITKTE